MNDNNNGFIELKDATPEQQKNALSQLHNLFFMSKRLGELQDKEAGDKQPRDEETAAIDRWGGMTAKEFNSEYHLLSLDDDEEEE